MTAYKDFTTRLGLLISKNPHLIITTLSNIFTCRLIGNKTHGDLAEIAIAEFINQYMYDFRSVHVGKDLYRAKDREEDILVINEITKAQFPVSLKAYGDGPLQLSTDKGFQMFPKLESMGALIQDTQQIETLWKDPAFAPIEVLNILPLIYDEKQQRCNILVFDQERARKSTARIVYEEEGGRRKHPVYRFYDSAGNYICEVRYGGPTANALQRGLWTHTKSGAKYLDSITRGWVSYVHNHKLVEAFSRALVSTPRGHEAALREFDADIAQQKSISRLD